MNPDLYVAYVQLRARNVEWLRRPWWSPAKWFNRPDRSSLELLESCVEVERSTERMDQAVVRFGQMVDSFKVATDPLVDKH